MKKLRLLSDHPRFIYLLSAAVLLILAWLSVGYYHPDEHFQILEFARWKLDPSRTEPLPWEFHSRMRPTLQPALVVAVHKIFGVAGANDPFRITFFLRLLSAGLTYLSLWMMYRRYEKEIGDGGMKKGFLLLSFLLWFVLYNGVRFSSETWSGAFFLIGFSYLGVRSHGLRAMDYLATGFLLGLSFAFRYQTGFLVAGFLGWLIVFRLIPSFRNKRVPGNGLTLPVTPAGFFLMLAGLGFALFAGVLADRWFYGAWVPAAWNYLDQNILSDKISGFGIQPWWFYFSDVLVRAIPPFSLVFVVIPLIALAFRPRDLLTWTLVPFLFVHFLIGHKETRFLYPIAGFLPVLIIRGLQIFNEKIRPGLKGSAWIRIFTRGFWIVNFAMMGIVFFVPADNQIHLYRIVYRHSPQPATLYCFSANPYERALPIGYYKRKDLAVTRVDSAAGLDTVANKNYLVAVMSKDPEFGKMARHRRIYSTFPQWLHYVNVNHWIERTQQWQLYEPLP